MQQNNAKKFTNENDKEMPKGIYRSPEKGQKLLII